jgi:hypothetical protein
LSLRPHWLADTIDGAPRTRLIICCISPELLLVVLMWAIHAGNHPALGSPRGRWRRGSPASLEALARDRAADAGGTAAINGSSSSCAPTREATIVRWRVPVSTC